MRILGINGSPRKTWNTADALQNALQGAAAVAQDVETELINLYDLQYQGCISCFRCKLIGGSSYGRCWVKDDLQPVLAKIIESDAVIFGSPVYFSDVTGMARCMFERLCFPLFVYDKDHTSLAPKKVRVGFIYTMNVTRGAMEEWGYPKRLMSMENFVGAIFSCEPKTLYFNNTLQFKNYSKYMAPMFSEKEKLEYREKHFPEDCRKAYEMGASLAVEALADANTRTE